MPISWAVQSERDQLTAAQVPVTLIDEWERDLLGNRDFILSQIQTQISDLAEYEARLATPSYTRYADFVNPAFPGATGILAKQRVKVLAGGQAYIDSTTAAFAAAGAFDLNVTAKKAKMENIRFPLTHTGDKVRLGWGPIPMTTRALVGDSLVETYAQAGLDVLTNPANIENVYDVAFAQFVSPMLVSKAVQAMTLGRYAQIVGDTTLRDALITAFNAEADTIINSFLDATHLGAGFDVTLVLSYEATPDRFRLVATDTHLT